MAHGTPQIRSVAVVGAGISGVCAAAHLLRDGLDVRLFERSSIAGGVWHFDERTSIDPDYPNEIPSRGDYDHIFSAQRAYCTPPRTPRSDQEDDRNPKDSDDLEIRLAPPGPCYAGLKNNVSLTQMKTTLADWPEGLEDFVSQRHLEEYIQEVARSHGVNDIAEYNTRVEDIVKASDGRRWKLRTLTLTEKGAGEDVNRLFERAWTFDAVVVASGHYNMPRIPDIPGLREWKARFPAHIWHSKCYRSPANFEGKRVLLIGAGVSSNDIAKESVSMAEMIYQSSRGGDLDLPPSMLPAGAMRIGGVKAFTFDRPNAFELTNEGHLPGYIEMTNGSKLCNIDNVVLCTGYVTSYPFLAHLHADNKQPEDADKSTLVTVDGNMVHNLYKDIFYIPDPTLAFVGAPYHISTFSLFEFQAQLIARVFAGRARLPIMLEMEQEYNTKVQARGLGRDFHSLRGEGEELEYVRGLVELANADPKFAKELMLGHTNTFLAAYEIQRERLQALGRRLGKGAGESFDHVLVNCHAT